MKLIRNLEGKEFDIDSYDLYNEEKDRIIITFAQYDNSLIEEFFQINPNEEITLKSKAGDVYKITSKLKDWENKIIEDSFVELFKSELETNGKGVVQLTLRFNKISNNVAKLLEDKFEDK